MSLYKPTNLTYLSHILHLISFADQYIWQILTSAHSSDFTTTSGKKHIKPAQTFKTFQLLYRASLNNNNL